MTRFGAAWVVGLLLVGFERLAFGYCLMTTCDTVPTPESCAGSRDEKGCSNEGPRVAWAQPCLSFSVYHEGSARSGITAAQLEDRVTEAFGQWQQATCSDETHPRLVVEAYPRVQCKRVGYYEDGPNQNLWIFRDNSAQADGTADSTIALTTLTIDKETGEILDADVELYSRDKLFTLSTDDVQTDLLSVVLHESGHVLGLGHSDWTSSTMASGYNDGSLEARSLEADDIRAICALMPPGEIPTACDAEPRGGFSTQCVREEGCCALAPGSNPRGLPVGFGLLLLGSGLLRRRYAKVLPSQPQR